MSVLFTTAENSHKEWKVVGGEDDGRGLGRGIGGEKEERAERRK